MVKCGLCGKEVKTAQALRGHKNFVHGSNTQQPVARLAIDQPVSKLEDRLSKLEYITGLREADLDELLSNTELPVTYRLTNITEQLSKLSDTVSRLNETVSKLSEKVELISNKTVSRDECRDTYDKLGAEIEYLLGRVRALDDIGHNNWPVFWKKLGALHTCPDCGRSLHLHRTEPERGLDYKEGKVVITKGREGHWHLECVHCGYYTDDYKWPQWKEAGANLFAAKKGAKE